MNNSLIRNLKFILRASLSTYSIITYHIHILLHDQIADTAYSVIVVFI